MKKWLFLFTFLLCAAHVKAQQDIIFEKYTQAQGLTSNNITCLLQDRYGFLWIGTGWGLNRYDGRVFKQYNHTGKNGLTDLAIRSLAEDVEGNIWIGTELGLNRLNPHTGVITQYIEGRGPGTVPSNSCYLLYVDRNKTLWVGTNSGLASYDAASNEFVNTPISLYGKDLKANRFFTGALEDSRGRFWLSSSYGAKLFDPGNRSVVSLHKAEPDSFTVRENVVMRLYEDTGGGIWACTWGGGILKYNEGLRQFEHYLVAGTDSADVFFDIKNITFGGKKCQLISGGFGLLLADLEKSRYGVVKPFQYFNKQKGGYEQFAEGASEMLTDRQGNTWIATILGLQKIDPLSQVVTWKSLPDKAAAASRVFHIIPSIEAPQHLFYLSTVNGWWKYNTITGEITPHLLPTRYKSLLSNINRFVTTPTGYWFTSQEGAGFYDIQKGTVTDLTSRLDKKYQMRTWGICKDNGGRIWFTVRRSGIRVYDPANDSLKALFNDLSDTTNLVGRSLTDLYASQDGGVWFNTDRLYRINPVDLSFKSSLIANETNSRVLPHRIYISHNGIPFFTSEQVIYTLRNNQLEPIFPRVGRSDFLLDNMIEDNTHQFWLKTNTGLYKTDSSFERINNMSGLLYPRPVEEFSEMYCTADGIFFIAGKGGINVFNTQALAKKGPPPVTLVNRVKGGNQEFFLADGKQLYVFSYKDAIELELSALNFSNEKNNSIYYQLEGWDTVWKELVGVPVVRYEQLPPGRYTFKSKSKTAGGVWSKEEATVSFVIRPPFYRTSWFILLSIVVLAAVVYGIYRYRLRQALQLEKMRTRIATDLHDDIGATLSAISMYSEVLKGQVKEKLPHLQNVLDKMGENSRDMVSNMSDIVWAINPGNDHGERLLLRMENYALDIAATKSINLRFNGDEAVNALNFTLDQRRDIYLIFKEAMNNAVKYSEAASITVNIKCSNRRLELEVRDSGKGFNPDLVRQGNGLKNMSARAAQLKGQLSITSDARGTSVLLVCNV